MNENWWPKIFKHIKDEDPLREEYITVAEIISNEINGNEGYKFINTALISEELLKSISIKNIGCKTWSAGPFPDLPDENDAYIPTFWINVSEISKKSDDIEPLIISWESNNRTVIWPDQGFLMTYGLVPRIISNDAIIHWDEPCLPDNDVIILSPVSIYDFPNSSPASIKIKKDYLFDYATLRKKIIIQLYYEERYISFDEELKSLFKEDEEAKDIHYNDHAFYFIKPDHTKDKYHAEIRGFRKIISPGKAPITEGRWNYGELSWPGIDEEISKFKALNLRHWNYVYVRDTVLEKFENRDEYNIHPESGAVSYGNQWAVSYCKRIGRDIIRLELKKLYEGNTPEIVRHWHSHAVPPPSEDFETANRQKNVAQRAKELIFSYLDLGESLCKITSSILKIDILPKDIISFEREKLNYYGWWNEQVIKPITNSLSPKMTKNQFLDRCRDLYKAIAENLKEKLLRKLLIHIGFDKNSIEEYESLKLLDLLIKLIMISNTSGLNLSENNEEIIKRYKSEDIDSRIQPLFALNGLRTLSSHITGSSSSKRFSKALEIFEIDPSSVTSTYSYACDQVYDKLIATLLDLNYIVRTYLNEVTSDASASEIKMIDQGASRLTVLRFISKIKSILLNK